MVTWFRVQGWGLGGFERRPVGPHKTEGSNIWPSSGGQCSSHRAPCIAIFDLLARDIC